MYNPVTFFIGLRYILARKRSHSVSFIAGIAMAGLILGVALLIVVLSVMNGFDKELRERILKIVPQISLYHSQGISQWQQLQPELIAHSKVVAAAPFVELQGIISAGKKAEPALIYGVTATHEGDVSIIQRYLTEGTLAALNARPNTLSMGKGLAEKLGLAVGDSVTLVVPKSGQQRRAPSIAMVDIIDIFTTQTELDQSLVLMGLAPAAGLTDDPTTITGMRIKVEDLFSAPLVADELRQSLPYGFYTSNWTRTHGNIYHAVQLSKKLVGLLLVLIIAIAAFNVVSTLVMVVVDKQSAVAILRTLGMTSREIMIIFIVQGAVIGVVGTVLGTVLGLGLSLGVQGFVDVIESLFGVTFLKADIYPISYLPSQIVYSDVMMVAGVGLLMSLLATIYPAWKAASIKPAQALRYE